MSQPLSELCTLLVDDFYGELCSRIFSVLLQYGRLSKPVLRSHSSLSLRHVNHGLAVLIQQYLVLHFTGDDETTFYEANWQSAYNLVRSGKFVQFIEERYDEASSNVASNLLLLGHARVKDLAEAYGVNKKKQSVADNTNGYHSSYTEANPHIKSLAQLHSILRKLEHDGFIVKVDARTFTPAADLHNEAERIVRAEWHKNNPKETKKQPDFEEKVLDLTRKWRGGQAKLNKTSGKLNIANLDAIFEEDDILPSRKRRKINGNRHMATVSDSESETEVTGNKLDDDAVFRMNFEKCEVAMRNQRLVKYVQRVLGSGPATVYEAVLRCMEDEIMRCNDELSTYYDQEQEMDHAPSTTLTDIMAKLHKISPDADLSFGVPEPDPPSRKGPVDDSDDPDEDHPRPNGQSHATVNGTKRAGKSTLNSKQKAVDDHLELLTTDPRQFVLQAGRSKYKVNFRALTAQLLQHELENTVKSKFGDYGATAVRIMKDKGKLDEKQLCNLAMIRTRDMRGTLSQMQQAGYLENQEVPKDNSRQPSRTLYLWFFDDDRCRQLILIDTYKAMSRILQRIKTEQVAIQPVIDKAERKDVVGHEDEFLSVLEKTGLRVWLETEDTLLAQLARQDELVAVLRDYKMKYLPSNVENDD